MLSKRQRPVVVAATALAGIWLLAWGGLVIARNSKQTAEKVAAYLRSVELGKLTGEARSKALRGQADRMNLLPRDERR